MHTTVGDLIAETMLPFLRRPLPAAVSPWWWPRDDGRSLADWGLTEARASRLRGDQDAVLELLRGGAEGRDPDLEGFLGSVGSTPDSCDVVLVSTRPSQDAYPGMSATKLTSRLAGAGLTARTHVTNLIKFRGHIDDETSSVDDLLAMPDVDDAIARRMIHVSLTSFRAELRMLKPRCILIAGGGTRSTIARMSEVDFDGSHLLREALDGLPQVHVRSWVAPVHTEELEAEWRDAVEDVIGSEPTSREQILERILAD